MSYFEWAPYVSVAERRKKAEKAAAKAKKAGAMYSPIAPYRGAIAKTFWGKAWCDNLEAYSDYANRMPRGRTYVRNGSVIDLVITEGAVQARVMGSSLYKVSVTVQSVPTPHWQAIGKDCAGSIDSLVELLQGKLSTAVMQRICEPRLGLFPAPKEISFSCSCPDSASMCKHIAAVLYGVGARLDHQPELLFSLRRVDAKDLVAQAGAGLAKSNKTPASSKVLEDAMLADVFGLEMDGESTSGGGRYGVVANAATTAAAKKKSPTKKAIAVKMPTKKTVAKKAAAKKTSAKATPAEKSLSTASKVTATPATGVSEMSAVASLAKAKAKAKAKVKVNPKLEAPDGRGKPKNAIPIRAPAKTRVPAKDRR